MCAYYDTDIMIFGEKEFRALCWDSVSVIYKKQEENNLLRNGNIFELFRFSL